MDVREKLVELLGNIYLPIMDGPNTIGEYTIPHKFNEKIADHLIRNGVTVQGVTDNNVGCKWISVDERLPENFISVLGYMTDAGEFPPVRECYTVGNAFFFPALADVHPVSHWCEMPEPPKGE